MTIESKLECFKAYDVRGKIGEQLNEEISYRIGRATAQFLGAKSLALGFDARETSQTLAEAVSRGIRDAGADVFNIGLAGTEEVYSAVSEFSVDGGIEVTASHNPIDYNGMKFIKKGSKPLTVKEFLNIQKLAEQNNFINLGWSGSVIDKKASARNAYINKVLGFIDLDSLKPLKIVINSGNGAAGPTIDALTLKLKEKGVKTHFFYLNHDPDPSFPNGIPNPLLEENRHSTAAAVVSQNADLGVAFDGDFDRCFLFDQRGEFISGEYIVGLLAEIFLSKNAGASIVHDPRVTWNTLDVVNSHCGNAIVSKTGHAFVKAAMRETGAVYGGEMSAHHYFKDFAYCDSGIIPWLMVWEFLSKKKLSLADLISERVSRFPSSGELNFSILDAEKCIKAVKDYFHAISTSVDELDGLSMTFENWRFNLRKSNTEPLVRLNVETIGDQFLLKEKIEELKKLIQSD